jgi:hypothetical protein
MLRWHSSFAACAALALGPLGCAGDYRVEGPLSKGDPRCGGRLALVADWNEVKPGSLEAKGAVVRIEPVAREFGAGADIELEGGERFVLFYAVSSTPAPIAVGTTVEVAIRCEPVGRDVVDCNGRLLRDGQPIALYNDTVGDWTVEQGPLLARRSHPQYGPMSTFALELHHAGKTATTPLVDCAVLTAADGTFVVSGSETEHAPPLAADTQDTRSFSILRLAGPDP